MSLVLPLPAPPRSPHHFPNMSPPSRGSTPTQTTPTASPTRLSSRPSTPPPLPPSLTSLSPTQPISAPSTPVVPTHLFPDGGNYFGIGSTGMERCKSSDAAFGGTPTTSASIASSPLGPIKGSSSKLGGKSHATGSGAQPHHPLLAGLSTEKVVNGGGGGGNSGSSRNRTRSKDRGSARSREPKATSLLFRSTPSEKELAELGKGEWAHIEKGAHAVPSAAIVSGEQLKTANEEGIREDEKMDIDAPEEMIVHTPAVAEVEQVPVQQAHVEPIPVTEPEVPPAAVWGMPKWGREDERKEVRKGVRLVGMEELPGLIDQHAMLDIPSHVLFPWLHGISDDGQKGRDMAAFFGYKPPFEPPAYRGLCVLLAPPHPLDNVPITPPHSQVQHTPNISTSDTYRERSETMSTSSESYHSSSSTTEGTSPSISSWSPTSLGTPLKIVNETTEAPQTPSRSTSGDSTGDVQMHPCESKRMSPAAKAEGLDVAGHPTPCETTTEPSTMDLTASSASSSSDESMEETKPSCILLNALHVQDVFELPKFVAPYDDISTAKFRTSKLPPQINLRNLNIQQVKYSSISDIIVYAKNGVGNGVLKIAEMISEAQEKLYHSRMEEYYSTIISSQNGKGDGEGLNRPVKYGVWVVVEPFHKVEKFCPDVVNLTYGGETTENSHLTDLFDREAREARAMTRGCEVVEGFWVGNDCDVPGGADDGIGASVQFDLCVKASELSDMPNQAGLNNALRNLKELDRKRHAAARTSPEETSHSWVASPATIALRNLLSPSSTPSAPLPETTSNKRLASPSDELPPRRKHRIDTEYIYLECAGSCRTITGAMRSLNMMTDRVVELVYFLRKLIEGREKTSSSASSSSTPPKRKVLVHCQDGYTESSILVLAYIMSSLSISLPEAFLHLQLVAGRSFFLYPSDKPLLRKIDARFAADRRASAIKLVSSSSSSSSNSHGSPSAGLNPHSDQNRNQSPPVSPTSPTSRWKSWGFGRSDPPNHSGNPTVAGAPPTPITPSLSPLVQTVEVAKELLSIEEKGGSKASKDAKVWFDDRRFDGFPSRILPFLYLGNLEHAGNAAMLKAIGISHVVSVGESLISCPPDLDPMYGAVANANTLSRAHAEGEIKVLDLNDVRDDGNDPLRPLIARACAWIESARLEGGTVLVHCRVGVSRSASIVMAYMMQYQRMTLMDAYLVTRARRLNVLIQPNLRFFHELFGWEVELAKRELDEEQEEEQRRNEVIKTGVQGFDTVDKNGVNQRPPRRRIMYTWPSFCRDLHCLNRRFLYN